METSSLQNFDSSSAVNSYSQLGSAVLNVQSQLEEFFISSNAPTQLDYVYDITDFAAKEALLQDNSIDGLNFPQIEVLSEQAMQGALGAYSTQQNTIYLSESLLELGQDGLLTRVLLEETGHFFDTLLNPGGDTSGDEGELFQNIVMGNSLSVSELTRIQSENDWGMINVNGANVLVEQDNSLSSATNLGNIAGNRSLTGFVGSSDTNDYYRFTVSNNVGFSLDLTGLSADADLQLLNSSGGVISSSTAGGATSDFIRTTLSAGTYFARVYQFSGDTNYNLSLRADAAGNSTSAARNIGTLGSTQNFTDYVGATDTNDYYRFSLNNTSNFSLSLSGMTADGDVQLLNSSGGVITSSTAGGSTSESINTTLSAGTYFVRVYPFSTANTNYNLSLSASINDNTLSTARNIGTLSSTQFFSDFVGTSDTNDYYRFSLDSTRNFSLSLSGMSADGDVQLLNSSGGVITSSALGGSSSESIITTLNAGTYFVRVYPFGSANTNYNLSLGATLSDGAGNSLGAARNIGTLGSTQNFTDFVGTSDTNDYYRFNVSNYSNFSLSLSGMSADGDVQLLNSSGGVIASSALGGSSSESINTALGAGTYYVRVYPFGSANTSYNLSLGASVINDNSISVARNIGTLSGTRSFSDFVGTTDTNDYYRFSLDSTRNFNLSLNGMTADGDVQLLNSSGGVITSSTAGGSASESIITTLGAGTYFVRVYPFGSANTNYNLSLTA
ncbi:PPC domain-containing protein [Gloeocapsa sp. PCC 73106]|uniref:beta strand repeat-containing protein n=1 Tax=Gloeocapsa sp. PCC 73106 TaxID=102232 RepID=UPI0002ACC4E9|nr:PPC domain-containing protein [Gloeocapsa sp. PCC 73106]ELR97421.1 putative pre-peptidase [Gloeocapsa sp. PCC 73106]